MGAPGPEPWFTTREVLEVFRRQDDSGAPLTASEVANRLGCARRTAYEKLDRLADEGRLQSKKAGARSRVWWRSDRESTSATDQPANPDRVRADRHLLERILETSPMAIALLEQEGTIIRANQRAADLLGTEKSELVGLKVDDQRWDIRDRDGERVSPEKHVIQRVVSEKTTVSGLINRITLPGGETRWLSTNFAPTLSEDGSVEHVLVTAQDITKVKAQQQEIAAQRARLAELDQVNTVIRRIIRGVIGAEDQAQIEQTTCNRLTAPNAYEIAAIGDLQNDEFSLRQTAGFDALASRRTLASPGLDLSECRQTGEIQVWRDDPIVHPPGASPIWSIAAIPLTYVTATYGFLLLGSSNRETFHRDERTVLAELGDTIGHAINALQRKAALITEKVIELELRETGELASLFSRMSDTGPISGQVDRTVLLDDGAALLIVRISVSDPDQVQTVLEQASLVDEVRIIDRDQETARFELLTHTPTLAHLVATYGGRIKRVEFDGDEVNVLAELPFGTDVGAVLGRIKEVYPGIEFVRRKTTNRERASISDVQEKIQEELTQRQRAALEASYAAGYFQWPRDATGEELANIMDISRSTFHKHLRRGQHKLLETVFTD